MECDMNSKVSYKRAVKIAIPVILAVLLVTVVLQNREEVETRLVFFTIIMPQAALLGVLLVSGYLLGILTMLFVRRGNGQKESGADKW
jgi:uncharacterized integral membrane protein